MTAPTLSWLRLRALDRKLLRDAWRMRGQGLAIALVVATGVGMFVMYRSTFDSLTGTLDAYYARGRFGDVFASCARAPKSLEARIAAIRGVGEVEMRVVADVVVDVPDMTEPAVGHLISIPADGRPRLNDLFLRRGRWIAPGRPDEVMVAESFALRHDLAPGNTLTATLNGHQRRLEIVGVALSPELVFGIRPGDMLPDPRRFGGFWMEERALAAAFDLTGSANDVVLRLAPGGNVEEVMGQLDTLLAPWGGTGAIPRSLQISNWYLQNEIAGLKNVGGFIPVLFLGVAVFLLNVVLTRTVGVEREQIAALKAVGYRNRELGWHYLKLGLAIAVVGCALGVVLGMRLGSGLTGLYQTIYSFPVLVYHVAPYRLAQAVGIALVAAAVGALGAVQRVALLPPAEAMRPEAPTQHRRTLVERIPGVGRLLTPPLRMILRNVSRRPLRFAVGVLGIGLAGGLVVVGHSFRVAVGALVTEQFGVLQRQDATVTFRRPTSGRVVHELARLPGVVHVEPLRVAAVRFRHGARARRAAIQGLSAVTRLERVLAEDGTPVVLPSGGLVLSTALAEILDVRAGELLTVEVLEGARRMRTLPVARLVDQHMGTAAYLELGALQRLVGDDLAITAAALQVEPSRADALYARLKDLPVVASVARKAAFVESFEQTFAKNLNIIVFFNILFAIVIAFGVVYNSGRIALAERSRELASLRVLGLRRSEISFLFLGELSAIVLAALPVAAAFGYGLTALALHTFKTELYRFPLVVARQSYALAGFTVVAAALLTGLVLRRQLDRLDLLAALKTPE